MQLDVHPLAQIFPPMSEEAFKALVDDIKENGLREPIIIHDGQVLDGRNRYRACSELGIEPITRAWDRRGTALSFVISKNLHRRHLNESQRAMVAAKIESISNGGNRGNQHVGGRTPIGVLPRKDVARMLNVGATSIHRASAIQDLGVPELQAAVEAGNVSAWSAETIARQPQEEQRVIVARGEKAITAAAKAIRSASPTKKRSEGKTASSRSENKRIRAEVWAQFRDALFAITGLPLPSEVATIAREFDRAGVVDARLSQSIQWLEDFSNEFRNRNQDSNAA